MSPEPDTYGPHARASLIADYIELLALKSPVNRHLVADYLADTDWNMALVQSEENGASTLSGSVSDRLDQANDVAAIVFDQIDERRRILRDLYPYRVRHDVVEADPDLDCESSRYVALLSLTVAHAFRIGASHRLDALFEEIVTRALRNRGLSVVGLAAIRRGSFQRALRTACSEVGLQAAPNAASRLVHAHDSGVDVLCHMGWDDDLRSSSWVFLGQVTVGRSDGWVGKMKEPSPGPWARFVGIRNSPTRFLAVPHHVERPMMEMLAQHGEGVVLDRLRLVRYKDRNDCTEREIIRTVAAQCLEPFTG